ncbi:MAG: hypothetical protein QOD75_3285 [Blastocatellia bacterium]|jgi:hypothetical protein|nr:hypothetical protein [Blastocatellia bacterium]
MKKQLVVVAVLFTLSAFGPHPASAQLPGRLKIPKVNKPKPNSTPAETTQPAATPNEPRPAAEPQPAAATPGQPQQAVAGSGALAVLKHLVTVNTRTVTSYKGDGSTYSWTPVVTFDTNGNIPSGAQYYAVVSLPGGAPWVEMDCTWVSGNYKSYYQCGGPNVPEEKGTTATGVFPFAIKMRNELKGIDQTLFTGKVKIEKAPDENGTPAERAKKSFFFPNMDWALPIGYVYYSPADNHLYTAFWVRGSTYKVEPHLFYQGKEIGLEGKPSCNDRMEVGDAYIRTVKPAPLWKLVECEMRSDAMVKDKGEQFAIPIHYLMSNPGAYEIKVLWNDELSRSIKFTVGAGGDFAGGVPLLYRVRDRDGDRESGVIVPVAILDAQDGPWNKAAWKTDAFYGNPPPGFTGPQ